MALINCDVFACFCSILNNFIPSQLFCNMLYLIHINYRSWLIVKKKHSSLYHLADFNEFLINIGHEMVNSNIDKIIKNTEPVQSQHTQGKILECLFVCFFFYFSISIVLQEKIITKI